MKKGIVLNLYVLVLLAVVLSFSLACGRKGPEAPPDKTPPTIITTSPEDGTQSVPTNINMLSATFSEELDLATINNQTVVLMQGSSPVSGTVTYSEKSVIFTPAAALSPNSTYTFTIDAGVLDLAGNAMVNKQVCIFITGSAPVTMPPKVESVEPTAGSGSVSIFSSVTVTFNRPMDPLTVNETTITVSAGVPIVPESVTLEDGVQAVLTFSQFSYETDYTATILADAPGVAGVKDLAGNTLVENYSWTFKTVTMPAPQTSTLTIEMTGRGSGTVTAEPITPPVTWNGRVGSATYGTGTEVVLTADANDRSTFEGWSGCDSDRENECRVYMTESKRVTADFARIKHTISATTTLEANKGILPSGPVEVEDGDSRTFAVTPQPGYAVDVIVDDVSKGGVESWIFENVMSDHKIHASFSINAYTLTVNKEGTGTGTVGGGGTYDYGATATVTAAAGDGAAFTGWSGDCSGTVSPTTVVMDGDKTCTASFSINAYTLTVNKEGTGTGTVGGAGTYNYGATATVTAAAGDGAAFTGWSGDCSGTVSPTTVVMDGDKTCTASFSINAYTLTVNKEGTGTGTVGGAGTYNYGATATVTAAAGDGAAFTGWSGDCSGTVSPTTVVMDGARTCTASFTAATQVP